MSKIDELGGAALTPEELKRVEAATGLAVPRSLASFLTSTPLIGLTLELEEGDDESGLGCDFQWMTPDQMIEEARDTYPGIMATPLGFLPVGMCNEGSGDPYFVRLADEALVRIPHETAVGDELDVEGIEQVTSSLQRLLETATMSHYKR